MLREFLPGTIRVIANITPILVFFVFAQILDIQTLGSINYFISLITILGIFTDFGIPEAIQRYLPQKRIKKSLVSHTIRLEFFIVLIAAITLLISDLVLQTNISKGFLILTTLILFFSASNTIILIFNGLEDKKSVTKYFGLSSLIFFITTFTLYFFLDYSAIYAFLLGRLISWAIYTVIPIYNLFKQGFFQIQPVKKTYSSFNKFAINTFIYMGSLTLLTQWDSLLVTHIDGEYTNGIYKSVVFIATIPIVLVTILHTKLLPLLSKFSGEKKFTKIQETLNKHIKYLAILLGIAFLIQLLIYEPVLQLLLPEEIVHKAGHLFPIAFSAILLHILSAPYICTLQAIGQERVIRNLSVIQVFIFISLTIALYNTYSFNIFPSLLLLLNLVFLIVIGTYSYQKLNLLSLKYAKK